MPIQTTSVAQVGYGTTTFSGANLADTDLATLLGAALPVGCTGADIRINSGTVYIENDGTAADGSAMPFTAGEKWSIRNSPDLLKNIHLFASAAYNMSIALCK